MTDTRLLHSRRVTKGSVYKVQREKKCDPKTLYSAKVLYRNKTDIGKQARTQRIVYLQDPLGKVNKNL